MTSLELFFYMLCFIGVSAVIFIIGLVLDICCAHHILRSMEEEEKN